jgi:hypothetical protein
MVTGPRSGSAPESTSMAAWASPSARLPTGRALHQLVRVSLTAILASRRCDMLKTMSAAALSFLLAVGGGVAFAESGGHASPPPKATSSQASGQQGSHANNMPRAVGFASEEVETAPWTVQSIDKQNRNLVLRGPDGTQNTVNIPAGTPGFDSLKKGDQIQLDYYEAAVVGVPANTAKPSSQSGSNSGSAQGTTDNNAHRQVRSIRKVDHNNQSKANH